MEILFNKVSQKASKGSHRIAWDLTHFNPFAISSDGNTRRSYRRGGTMATPGTYSASLHLEKNGIVSPLDGPITFEVTPIYEGVLKGTSYQDFNTFRVSLVELLREINSVQDLLNSSTRNIKP